MMAQARRYVRQWVTARLLLGVLLIVAVVAVVSLKELIFSPREQSRIVLNAPAGACPNGVNLQALRCEVNAVRRANGLRPWRINLRLRAAAERHARDMVARRYFNHSTPDGRNVAARARAAGYLRGAGRWRVGENIAYGSGELARPASIVGAWMRSPPHRAVLLDRGYVEGGGGIATGTPMGGEGITYVLNVGRRYEQRTGRWG